MPHADGWTVHPGELTWVNDAGIIDKDGYRVYREDGQAAGKPSWHMGDAVGLSCECDSSRSRCSARSRTRRHSTGLLYAESGSAKDGQRWPWVTMIRVLQGAPADSGPTLDELEVGERGCSGRQGRTPGQWPPMAT